MATKKNLESIPRNFGLRGWSGMKKDELAVFINDYLFSPPIFTFDWMRKEDLQALARKRNLRGWTRMNKENLRKFLDNQGRKQRNLMNLPDPKIDAPVLVPEKAPFPAKEETDPAKKKRRDWLKWVEWLENEPEPPPPKPIQEWLFELRDVVRSTAMRGFFKEFVIKGRQGELPRNFFNRTRPQVVSLINREKLTKVKLMLTCLLSKTNLQSGEYIEVEPTFLSKNKVNLEGIDAFEIFDEMVEEVMVNMANYQKEGSNLQFEKVNELVIPFAKFQPLGGSSFMPLPDKLKNKKAIVNMKNEDQECFKWCATRALNQVESHQERVTEDLRKQSEKLDWGGMSFPTTLQQIGNFERRNGLAIFVFGFDGEIIFPLRKAKENGTVIDLLLLTEESGGRQKSHYCWIKSLNRLLDTQVTKYKGSYSFCRNCLNHFSLEKLAIHQESCLAFDAVKIEMPEEGHIMKFGNFNKKMEFPFVIYGDFEAKLEKVATAFPSPKNSFTQKIQEHKPISFALHLVSDHWKPKPILYRARRDDEDVGKKFVEVLGKFVKALDAKTKRQPMEFGREDREKFNSATRCFICERPFEREKDKVRDHCHFTGKFRGAAHGKCNLMYRVPTFIPMFFHNLKNYDAHFIVKALGTVPGDIKCIANNEEKYISFSKKFQVGERIVKDKIVPRWFEVRFLDSAGFMNASLASLVSNLADGAFIETQKVFKDKWKLFQKKGVFPYEWLDSVERFKETCLPGKEAFYSHLTRQGIGDGEWEHAKQVWTEMGMKNMGEYHDAYLKADVTELADVMEEFRKVCRTNYGLDPVWYFTAPGLAWDTALKISKVELELLSDPDMLLFFERGIRGGVSTIFHRRAQANNKYMKDFDAAKPSVFVPYWDANGLYAWAMSHPLPVDGFAWMSKNELVEWENIPCVLEVDVDIPVELHDKFNDFPPLPEKVKMGGVHKLVPNLWNKRKMVVHRKALKQALQLGCVLKKVWRGLKFREKPWLKEFIELNVKLRQEAKNAFEKNFFKLMNNAVFGKTMENLRKRQSIELVCDEKRFLKLVAKSNYSHSTRFAENLLGVHMKKTMIVFTKPVYVGQAILDISKTCMYDFHYKYVKEKWPKSQLCFTDTDSLLYMIETEDLFEDIAGDVAENFNTSEFPSDHPKVLDGTIKRMNKKVLGMMKDETCGKPIVDFVGLKAKCYSFLMEDSGQRKCKGIKKDVIRRMEHKDWVTCLNEQSALMKQMTCFRSRKHEISTVVLNKLALSADDDKRVILADGIGTLAHGHWRI